MMFAKTACPTTTSVSSGESPAGRSGPPSTSARGLAATSAASPSPPTPAEAPSAEPAVEEAAATAGEAVATAGVAAAEVAEAPNTVPQPAQEGALEVVYGRCPLPSRVKVPLPHLMVKAQWATEEMEEGFWQEWEESEAERLRLSDWEPRLRDCIQVVASRAAEERAQLE
jgi:hypothetical protein